MFYSFKKVKNASGFILNENKVNIQYDTNRS